MLIDLNCDLGEGAGSDADVLPLITTANVACGFHAGDPATAIETIRLAEPLGVRIGAHPSYPDREHFGRQEMERRGWDIYCDCVYQIGALVALAKASKASITHVKAHGALYNQACREHHVARAVVTAADEFGLPVMGLPGSMLERLAPGRFIAEGFADRRYRPDGSLVPRSEPDAFVHDPEEASHQAAKLAEAGVRSLCVHGDNPQALTFVRALRESLTAAGFTIAPFA